MNFKTVEIVARKCVTAKQPSYWVIVDGQRFFDQLGVDEMLGLLARLLLVGEQRPYRSQREPFDPKEMSPSHLLYTLQITAIEGGSHFTIEKDGMFVSHMNSDELLGFVASYVFTGVGLFGDFQSYEQYAGRPWLRYRLEERPVRALLTKKVS